MLLLYTIEAIIGRFKSDKKQSFSLSQEMTVLNLEFFIYISIYKWLIRSHSLKSLTHIKNMQRVLIMQQPYLT